MLILGVIGICLLIYVAVGVAAIVGLLIELFEGGN
jgi:hypothetical protein